MWVEITLLSAIIAGTYAAASEVIAYCDSWGNHVHPKHRVEIAFLPIMLIAFLLWLLFSMMSAQILEFMADTALAKEWTAPFALLWLIFALPMTWHLVKGMIFILLAWRNSAKA